MANNHSTLTDLFTDIADAIRVKTGGTDNIIADNFPTVIAAIETGENLDPELSTQDDLIAQIATALEGKTGASGGTTVVSGTVELTERDSLIIPDLIGCTNFVIFNTSEYTNFSALDFPNINACYSLLRINGVECIVSHGPYSTKMGTGELDTLIHFVPDTGEVSSTGGPFEVGVYMYIGY